MASGLSYRVFGETRRAVDKFGKHSDRELRKIKNLYVGARKRISGEIAEQWPDIVKQGTTPFGLERLRGLQLGIDTELGRLNQDLNIAIPQMVGDAGEMGIYRGQVELAQLLHEFPNLHPTFGIINTQAIEVYSGYALQLSQQYTAELTRQIQSALQMGLMDQKTIGQLTTEIRQYMGAEYGKPAKAITYKAQRIARTEMARAYQGGHEAYGRSTDFIIGEMAHHDPMGPWPCARCENLPEGTEWIYAEGEAPPYPLHPQCRCYTTYLYRKELFTPAEMTKLRGLTPTGLPVPKPDPTAEIMKTLRTGSILKQETIGRGITDPQHLFFSKGIEGCAKSKYYQGEIASYRISKRFGGTVIPETAGRTFPGGVKGSVQRWIKGSKMGGYAPQAKLEEVWATPRYKEMRLWDWLFGNSDRHGGNWMIAGKNKVWAIDNGFTFEAGGYAMGQPAGMSESIRKLIEELPKKLVKNVAEIAKMKPSVLRNIAAQNISMMEANVLIRRATAVGRAAGLGI